MFVLIHQTVLACPVSDEGPSVEPAQLFRTVASTNHRMCLNITTKNSLNGQIIIWLIGKLKNIELSKGIKLWNSATPTKPSNIIESPWQEACLICADSHQWCCTYYRKQRISCTHTYYVLSVTSNVFIRTHWLNHQSPSSTWIFTPCLHRKKRPFMKSVRIVVLKKSKA